MRSDGIAANTLKLSFFTLMMRAVGMLFQIKMTSVIGTGALGLTQLVSIVYGFCVTLSCSGLRLASTQLCTRAYAQGKSDSQVLNFCIMWGAAVGSCVSLAMAGLASPLAAVVLKEPSLSSAIRLIAPAVPCIAMTSAMYGCLTARGKIVTLSVLQAAEQVFYIALVSFCLTVIRPRGDISIVRSIAAASSAAELFSLGLAAIFIRSDRRSPVPYRLSLREFFRIVLPSGISTAVGSLLRSAQETMVPSLLVLWGLSRSGALSLFGAINGIVYPVLFFPAALLNSLSVVIVPELTSAYVVSDRRRIQRLTKKLLRLGVLFSLICCAVFLFLSRIGLPFIKSGEETASLLLVFIPIVPLFYLDLLVDSVLRSLDRQGRATLCSCIDAALSLMLVQLLIPKFGAFGLALSVFGAKSANLVLSFMGISEILWGGGETQKTKTPSACRRRQRVRTV